MKPTTKDERSLLLYLEARAVDHGGKLRSENMNKEDHAILKQWIADGYVRGGRICSDHIDNHHHMWVRLGPEATADAHQLRAERATRMWEKKVYMTTEEKRSL